MCPSDATAEIFYSEEGVLDSGHSQRPYFNNKYVLFIFYKQCCWCV